MELTSTYSRASDFAYRRGAVGAVEGAWGRCKEGTWVCKTNGCNDHAAWLASEHGDEAKWRGITGRIRVF